MSKFKLKKKVDLSYLGDDWKDCYITFQSPSYKDIKSIAQVDVDNNPEEATEKSMDIMKDLFIEGLANTDKGKETIKKEDIGDLPLEILTTLIESIAGKTDPK